VAFPFHFFGILSFKLLQHLNLIHYTFSFEDPLRVLMGQYTDLSDDPRHTLSGTIAILYDNKIYLILGYVAVLALAFIVGHLLRMLVWNYELDVKWPGLFSYRSDWLYELLGRGKLFVNHPCFCYRLMGRPGPGSVPHHRTLVIIDAVTDQPMA